MGAGRGWGVGAARPSRSSPPRTVPNPVGGWSGGAILGRPADDAWAGSARDVAEGGNEGGREGSHSH